MCLFVAGAASRKFVAIAFIFVAKCCDAMAVAAFLELLPVIGDAAAVLLLLSGFAILESIFNTSHAYLFVSALFFNDIDIITL